MKIPYNILIQIKMSVRPYFKGFTLIFFFYNCRKQDHIFMGRRQENDQMHVFFCGRAHIDANGRTLDENDEN